MTTLQTKPTGWFKPDPGQPRKSFPEEQIEPLGNDLVARGVLMPLSARVEGDHGIIIDGEKRWLAATRKGIKELPVLIVDKSLSITEIRGNQIATAVHRSDLTPFEKWKACCELLTINPGWQQSDLATFLNLSPSAITKLMSPSKCTAAWVEAFASGDVGISECYLASGLDEEAQVALLAMKRGGATRDELAHAERKGQNQSKPQARISRLKYALPVSGVSIVASGTELSIDDLVEAFAEANKEIKRARDQGHDVKSFQAIISARSKNRDD